MASSLRYIFIILALSLLSLGAAADDDFIVVIDAGHGGHDYGAIGKTTNEKTINLNVALKLGKLLEAAPGVKVVYTRKGDYFKTLQERADIANEAHGDLFISIHTNSVAKNAKNRTSVKGASTYTLGLHRSEENLEVAKRENSVIMLEDDYTTTYHGFDPNSTESYIIFELSQNKHLDQSIDFAKLVQKEMVSTAGRADKGVRQGGLYVLAKTSMPAVLIELDFICNPTSEKFLGSESGQTKFARAIFNAFKNYKEAYDNTALQSGSANTPILPDRSTDTVKPAARTDANQAKADTTITPSAPATSEASRTKSQDTPAKAPKTAPPAKSEKKSAEGLRYKIQFMTSPEKLNDGSTEFKGLVDYDCYYDDGLWKYTIGSYRTLDMAKKHLPKIRKKFSEAFIIKTRDGKRIK
ncbi:MAG: N-acetylmuramoyl-L-alanine amidase [Muribaculum sp.]|nr:N-acetylmuramoyl-L-alanine amidase [Muribaculum sp.]